VSVGYLGGLQPQCQQAIASQSLLNQPTQPYDCPKHDRLAGPYQPLLEVTSPPPLFDLFSLPFECCSSFRSKGVDPSEFHRRYGRTDLCIAVMMDLGCTNF